MTRMFIDDERFPPEDGKTWVICRTSDEAVAWVVANGMPAFISFDHDLGGADTSMYFISWMVDELLDKKLTLPAEFDFYVHSQNPVGAKNIQHFMENIVREFK